MSGVRSGQASLEGDEIVIRVKLEHLPNIVRECPALEWDAVHEWALSDVRGFAQDIVNAINDEDHDGTTRFHRMFDEAIKDASEQGSEHIDWVNTDTVPR